MRGGGRRVDRLGPVETSEVGSRHRGGQHPARGLARSQSRPVAVERRAWSFVRRRAFRGFPRSGRGYCRLANKIAVRRASTPGRDMADAGAGAESFIRRARYFSQAARAQRARAVPSVSRCAKRSSESGSPGPGGSLRRRSASSRAGSRSSASSAATASRSSATTAPASMRRCARRSRIGGDPGADVPGLRGERAQLRDGACRGAHRESRRTRSRSTSCSSSAMPVPKLEKNCLRGPARHAPVRRA